MLGNIDELTVKNIYAYHIGAKPDGKTIRRLVRQSATDSFTLSRHRGVVGPAAAEDQKDVVSQEEVATANLKLAPYGFTMSKELLDACFAASVASFRAFYFILLELVSEVTNFMENGKTIWPNFPDDVMSASMAELYIANILNYLTEGYWRPGFDITIFNQDLSEETMRALKVIPLADDQTAANLIKELLTNSVPVSEDDWNDIKMLMQDGAFTAQVMEAMKGAEIPVKENLANYVAFTMKAYGDSLFEQSFMAGVTTAKDVLRIAVACSGGDVSLYKATRFRSFSRKERRMLLSMIAKTKGIEESMVGNSEVWKRLGEKLHPGEYQNEFPNVERAFAKIRAGAHITTYNTVLEQLLKAPVSAIKLAKHLVARPGMFARYLDACIRNCRDEDEIAEVRFLFSSVAKQVSPRVLVQLVNHFKNRNNPVTISVGRKKGMASRSIDRMAKPISKEVCARLCQDITNELWQVLRDGKDINTSVYIDPEAHCDKILFPDNVRQLSSGERVAACGSRFNIEAADTMRLFLFWKGEDGEPFFGIDLDLSVLFLDNDFKPVGVVSYYSPKLESVGGVHSGDRRSSGKDGAVEYIDFNVSSAKAADVRYAVMVVNSYSGHTFNMPGLTAFCGMMERDGTGKVFDPRTVTTRFNLTSESRDNVPVVIDLMTCEATVVDRACGSVRLDNLETLQHDVIDITKYAIALRGLTVSEMVRFRYPSIVTKPEQADVIISENPEKFHTVKETVEDSEKAPNQFYCCKETVKVLNPLDATGLVSLVFSD